MYKQYINYLILIFVFLTVGTAVSGCSAEAQENPFESPLAASSLSPTLIADVQILFKMDDKLLGPTYAGEHWVSPPTYQILVGDGVPYSIEVKTVAYGQDGIQQPIDLDWTAEDPQMVSIAPMKSGIVQIIVHRDGQTQLNVSGPEFSKTLTVQAEYRNSGIWVAVTQ